MNASQQRFQLMFQPFGDNLQSELEEEPEDLFQSQSTRCSNLWILCRNQARHVDGKVGLQRRMFV